MRADCLWMSATSSDRSVSSGAASPSVSAAAAIEAIGVRNSCETSATNVRRMASVRSSRVTSRSTPTAAAREPAGIGTTRTCQTTSSASRTVFSTACPDFSDASNATNASAGWPISSSS